MKQITILPGLDKQRHPETFGQIVMKPGELYAIVGNTGSGKSRLIKDIEQLANGDSITSRQILLDGQPVPAQKRQALSQSLVAHLGQNMRFVMDGTVEEFIQLHAKCRQRIVDIESILDLVNSITPEAVHKESRLNELSGGQSRALMIADIAMICDSPIVLIDEIENAGIDKEKALRLLCKENKLVLTVTHDPHTALMASQRIVVGNGAILAKIDRSQEEEILYQELEENYQKQCRYQALLRKGKLLV